MSWKIKIALTISVFMGLLLGCASTTQHHKAAEHPTMKPVTQPLFQLVTYPVSDDPTISFRVLFKVGSQNDPKGKEGLAALTAALLAKGSTQKHSYETLLDLFYPMAAGISYQVDKEMTVISGRVHKDNLDAYYQLFKEVIFEPAFNEADFQRVKSEMLNYVQNTLRFANDEELGKEVLYEFIFEGTPYGHLEEGHISSLQAITLDDVKQFYRQYYTQANLILGIGGGYSEAFKAQYVKDFTRLSKGEPATVTVTPKPFQGMHVQIVSKNANATAISFGYPITITRANPDFYALSVARSWLGEHRNSSSHLYQVIREKRGLNYGDYAYIEHFPNGGRRRFPPPNVARHHQIFQIWIRPVPNNARLFAFRAALRELQKMVDNGLTQEQFDLTRRFLKNYSLHYAPTTMMKLGYAMDDAFYGIPGSFLKTFRQKMDELTLEEVNAAIKKYLQYENIKVVFVTNEPEALKQALVNNEPSPITYPTPKPAEVLEEDKQIATYPLKVKPENVRITPIESIFQ